MTRRRLDRRLSLLALLVSIAACVDHLPDQDLRVLTTTPAAKLSADLLWQEFHTDAGKARGTYHGQVVEITGHTDPTAEGVVPASLTFSHYSPVPKNLADKVIDEVKGAVAAK